METASTSGDGRILFVSSSAHLQNLTGPINFDTIDTDLDYGRLKSYGRTKLYNVSFLFDGCFGVIIESPPIFR